MTVTTRPQPLLCTLGFLFIGDMGYTQGINQGGFMAGGRPTDYTPELLEKARDYLENFEQYGDLVPTVAGMACELKVHRDTLYEWSTHEEKQEFSDIFRLVMQLQERKLVNGGLSSAFNPAITKMMLTKHGYSDKQEIDHSSSDGTMRPLVTVSFDDTEKD